MADIDEKSRRRFLGLAGKAGFSALLAQAVGVNLGLVDVSTAQGTRRVQPFRFAIIADPHLYAIQDHVFDKRLEDAVAQVNAMTSQPDFVMIMGDVAHHGEADEMAKGKRILSKLKAPIRSIPGEHDWYLDMRGLAKQLRSGELVGRSQGRAHHRHELDPRARLLDRRQADAGAAP